MTALAHYFRFGTIRVHGLLSGGRNIAALGMSRYWRDLHP